MEILTPPTRVPSYSLADLYLAPVYLSRFDDFIFYSQARAGAEFAYYGTPLTGAELAWRDQWRGSTYLPLLVRLDLIFVDGEQIPQLIVAPRLRSPRPLSVGMLPPGAPPL